MAAIPAWRITAECEENREIIVKIGDWHRIVEYPHNHLNDFCLFKALDGRWHAIGIMGTGTWESETSLFHCSCDTLSGRYEIHAPLFVDLEQGATANDRPQKHAPFVVIEGGIHHIYFRRPWGTNLHLASRDTLNWPTKPDVVFEDRPSADARLFCRRSPSVSACRGVALLPTLAVCKPFCRRSPSVSACRGVG